jgi:penicillin-binding protein 2
MYALQVSCNCYFYELGRVMGIDLMNKYCQAYGLGESTGIELPEKIGILAGPQYREDSGLLGWTPGNTIAAAIGQSDNSFTPLQLANYIATVTGDGTRYSLHLLKEVRKYGESGEIVFKTGSLEVSHINLSDDALYAVRQGMKQMTTNDYAVSQYMAGLPVTVGGKTGTAQTGMTGANGEELLQNWFAGFYPAVSPQYVVVVLSEDYDSTGDRAAPVFRDLCNALQKLA